MSIKKLMYTDLDFLGNIERRGLHTQRFWPKDICEISYTGIDRGTNFV
jgi:hypothetical protein